MPDVTFKDRPDIFKYKNNTYWRKKPGVFMILGENDPKPVTIGSWAPANSCMTRKLNAVYQAKQKRGGIMTTIAFLITVEVQDEENLLDNQLESTLSDLEDLLMRHPAGFDLYDSEWWYEEGGEDYA